LVLLCWVGLSQINEGCFGVRGRGLCRLLASDWTNKICIAMLVRRGESGDDSGPSFRPFEGCDVVQNVSAPELFGAA
jgi:hypothetical protein